MPQTDINFLETFLRHNVLHSDQCEPGYIDRCREAWRMLSSARRAELQQLVEQGPVWDGDVISKQARDDLLHCKLASRACVKGEQGYTVANYRGWDVYKSGR